MKTIGQIEAEIAALQAELEERKSEPDLSEAVEEYRYGAEFPHSPYDNVYRGLIACWPALYKALGPRAPEPTEEDDKFLAWQVCVDAGYKHPHTREHHLAIAAIQSERKRAGGA
jgi:hypothetical protein